MTNFPRVCLVHMDGPLPQALRRLGCEVLELAPQQPGLFDLPAELSRRAFAPDLLIQRERLGPRLLLAGLETLPAVRMFWALDPHLNAFWQAPYARLFDVVLSTQRSWMPQLAACGADDVRHLPWHAPDRPFTPYAERPRLAGFVGRLGPTRPARTWLSELMGRLLPQGFDLADGLGFDAMLDFYQRTRLVPNESITGEVNFRLFEAAGCGAVVLAQDLGPEQAELFTPGREMLVCADALELADAVRLLSQRPRLAEAMGRAAWERAQAEHLPLARARALLYAADTAMRRGAAGADADLWLALSLAGLVEAGRLNDFGPAVARRLAALPQSRPEDAARVLDAQLRLAHLHGDTALLRELLARAETATEPPALGGQAQRLCLTCAAALLLPGPAARPDLPSALAFSLRAGVDPTPLPQDPAAARNRLLLAWARRLEDQRPHPRGGFSYDAARHLPDSATECLLAVLHLDPSNTEALRLATALLARLPGSEAIRLGLLSELTLRDRADWRAGLELGLLSLRCFRPEPGLEELRLARSLAATSGQGAAFETALSLSDPTGRLHRALLS